jgi:hypothetical protein
MVLNPKWEVTNTKIFPVTWPRIFSKQAALSSTTVLSLPTYFDFYNPEKVFHPHPPKRYSKTGGD